MTPDGSIWRYRYDPLGRRIGKQRFDTSGAAAEQTTFTWDGGVLAEEVTRPLEMTGPGRWCRVTWDYQPGTSIALAQTETLADDGVPPQAGQERFCAVITDHAGAPAELASTDGAIAGYRQHTLWVGTLWHPDGAATPLRPAGRYHDSETGLHYQQRFYDPLTASYLAPDPLDTDPGPGITREEGRNIGMTAVGIFRGNAATKSSL